MEIGHIIPHIEALIFASEKPLTAMEVTELINSAFGFMEDKLTLEQVQTAIDGIVEKYRSEFYPFEMRESGGGWQFLTKRDYHKTVAQLNGDKFLKRLSSAALETLAIIAYKQPVTKSEIEAIRGVSSDYAIQKLLEKELIMITGRNEKLPGHPLVYNTSKNFMDYFGINSADDLPKLKEVFDDAMVNPTVMGEITQSGEPSAAPPAAEEDQPESAPMLVGPHGELIEGASDANEEGNIDEEVQKGLAENSASPESGDETNNLDEEAHANEPGAGDYNDEPHHDEANHHHHEGHNSEQEADSEDDEAHHNEANHHHHEGHNNEQEADSEDDEDHDHDDHHSGHHDDAGDSSEQHS